MALMICPECGGQVSDKAHACPHCGYPIEELMKKGPEIPEVCLYEYKGETYDVTDIVWNGWASARKDILLIVCGSATSWIINKVPPVSGHPKASCS